MTRDDIATELVDTLRRDGETAELWHLYSPDVVSVEARAGFPPGEPRVAMGITDLKARHKRHAEAAELVSLEIGGPFPHGDTHFALHLKASSRDRETNELGEIEEIAVYQVANGAIVREEFYYS
ncbi:hypothetical protein V8J82_10595 [Gymnodinialimonas sp. 2305UL16-5]|uniref:hypothetical protein n=1 Tax=Gymnodinialimonas mytili TaxID=3126503 RepID=UPI0030B65F2E